MCKGPSINYVVSVLGGEGVQKLLILFSKKTTKRGGGGQKSPILRRHSLWTAPNNSWLKKTYVLAGVHNVECDEEVWEWVSLEANSRLSAIQSLGTPVQNESFHGHCWYRRFSYRALLWISYSIIFMIIDSLMAILVIGLNQFFEYKIWKLIKKFNLTSWRIQDLKNQLA